MQARLPFLSSSDEARTANDERSLVFVRHPRARRYVIRVSDDGSLRVTVPRWGSKREAAAFVEQERAWIAKQQRRVEQDCLARARRPPLSQILADQAALKARAKRELPVRLLELAAAHRLSVARISVRNQRWRWGSCSRQGHICLNWRLVIMPPDVRDYVLIHELMHLKRMDHSAKFWKLVAQICPEYQAARAYLRAFSRD